MRIANSAGRLVLLFPNERGLDVEAASDGLFTADPQAVYPRWDEFRAWADTVSLDAAALDATTPIAQESLGAVVPRPPQVFAIGLNYRAHAAESGFDLPAEPVVFTKYLSSLTGPTGDITLSPGNVDWEIELVAVIGRQARHVGEEQAWDHIAGLTVGQDISDRTAQFAAQPAQFGMGKSYPGYSPIGPSLVTPDDLDDCDDLPLGCEVNGETMQKGSTADMVFGIPTLIAKLSAILPLLPGDIIFTGTPAGVGVGRTPQRFLHPGDELSSWISGIGRMHHRFVTA